MKVSLKRTLHINFANAAKNSFFFLSADNDLSRKKERSLFSASQCHPFHFLPFLLFPPPRPSELVFFTQPDIFAFDRTIILLATVKNNSVKYSLKFFVIIYDIIYCKYKLLWIFLPDILFLFSFLLLLGRVSRVHLVFSCALPKTVAEKFAPKFFALITRRKVKTFPQPYLSMLFF